MKKVLIVDDASYMRMLIKKILIKEGFSSIYEASNTEEAIEIFRINQPEIITLDMGISESWRGGIDILSYIMDTNPEAIVIVISASGQVDLLNECRAYGVKEIIRKPFTAEALSALLQRYK